MLEDLDTRFFNRKGLKSNKIIQMKTDSGFKIAQSKWCMLLLVKLKKIPSKRVCGCSMTEFNFCEANPVNLVC